MTTYVQRNIEIIRNELHKFRREQPLEGDLHYTDAEKYAATWYGETYKATMLGSLDME